MTSSKCQWGVSMFKNKLPNGKLNISGAKVAKFRMAMPDKVSQNGLSKMLQLEGIDINKNAIQQMESGQRFITDIELKALAKVLGVSADDLLSD